MTPEQAFIQATKTRAKAYFYLYEELSKEFGDEKACEVFSRAIYRLGIDKSGKFSDRAGLCAMAFAEEFVKDPVSSKVFSQNVLEADNENARIEMKSCPLVDTWKEMKLSCDTIKLMCDLACQVDFGTIESKGYKLYFPQRIACGDESCILEVRRNKK